MIDLERLIQKYRTRGLLVDTNILLLLFIGARDRDFIGKFKRTAQFTADDWNLLQGFLLYFERIVTTPNVLTETINLAGNLAEPRKSECFADMAKNVKALIEKYVPSSLLAEEREFIRLGLTDLSIRECARGQYLVLTDDLRLKSHLDGEGIDAINFNHLRTFE